MAHNYPDALKAHLTGSRITVATRALITRSDGTQVGLTSHVKSQTIDGILHHATPGLISSAMVSRGDGKVDNASLSGFVTPDILEEEDLRSGLYDDAKCQFDLYNYNDIEMGLGFLGKGFLGTVRVATDGTFAVEFRSLEEMLLSEIGETTSVRCRNRGLGTGTCPVNMAGNDNNGRAITRSATVTAITDGDWGEFTASSLATLPDNFFQYGIIEWTSGANDGFRGQVQLSSGANISMWQPFFYPIEVGDTFTAIRGCNFSFKMCGDDFSDQGAPAYFNGEPDIQGEEFLRVNQN